MTNSFVAMVTYMGETHVFNVAFEDGFGFLMQKVSSNWPFLNEGAFSLYYAIRNKSRCCLGSEEDYNCLTRLLTLFSIDCVDFEVRDSVVGDVSRGQLTAFASFSSISVNVQQSYDIVPSFCKHVKPDLKSIGWEKLICAVDQRFEDGVEEFRICLMKFFVGIGRDFYFMKNSADRVKAVCGIKDQISCSWMVSASKEHADGSFFIRKLASVHTCQDVQPSFTNRNMTSDVVATLIEQNVRAKCKVRPVDVVKEISAQYGLSISYCNAWNSVEKAKQAVYGSEVQSFEYLNWYVQSTLETNPGSRIVLDVDETSARFRRMFIAYDACIKGFTFCRPVLFLDGTHLKTVYKGHLLSAVAKDGNQGLYPVVFAIVDSENASNWQWFLENLKPILDPGRVITFISDRNFGLVDSVQRVFPLCFHSFCLHHLKMNLRDRLARTGFGKGTKVRLIQLFTECWYAPTVMCYDNRMEEFVRVGGSVVTDFLNSIPVHRWANAHFKGMRYGEMCSNAVESFNNWILQQREMPLGILVDSLRVKLMKMLSDRRTISEKWTSGICVEINRRFSLQFHEGRCWPIIFSSPCVFEVQSQPSVMVDLSKRSCSCYGWQLNGIPCSHAIVCIFHSGLNVFSFIEPWFYSTTYQMCYLSAIRPIPTVFKPSSLPEEMKVLPPSSRRPPGRPKSKRIRSRGELVSSIKCGRCKRDGHHNRRSCKAPIDL